MRFVRLAGVAALLAVLALARVRSQAPAQTPQGAGAVTIAPTTTTELRDWDGMINGLLRDGTLRLTRERPDTLMPGRRHQRLDQYYRGVRVFGGDVRRQIDESGLPMSIFGTIYTGIELDPMPTLSPDEARQIVERAAGPDAAVQSGVELIILPVDEGRYALAYRLEAVSAADSRVYFIDARSGTLLRDYSNRQRQAAVGRGRGVLNDLKKVSATASGGTYVTSDPLRPPALQTFDMRGNLQRTIAFLQGFVTLVNADLASDADNEWTDGGNVDAHAYAGFVYDYLFKRFGRRGLDDSNLRILSLVHPVRRETWPTLFRDFDVFFTNAFWEGTRRVMVYGDGLPPGIRLFGQEWNYVSGALDIVGHELAHGLTQFTSDLVYLFEAGALNEAFSDVIGTSVEFFYQPPGSGPLQADYLVGEDVVTPGGLRSMANPRAYGDPDHYTRRYVGAQDNGGVHINSGIMNNAFYLAIEGGRNSTSGLGVQGVGPANREQVERVFYRAFAFLMPSNASFALARLATIQAASDLYGIGSPAWAAIVQAWDAVGVRERIVTTAYVVPDPVPTSANACVGVRPAWFPAMVVAAAGSGFTVTGQTVSFFNSFGGLINTQSLSAADFASRFDDCGGVGTRVAPNTDRCALDTCLHLGGRTSGFLEWRFSGRTDVGTSLTVSTGLVRLSSQSGLTFVDPDLPGQPTIGSSDAVQP